MKIRLLQRALSFALATVITIGLFGGIDHLADVPGAGAVWAQSAPAATPTRG